MSDPREPVSEPQEQTPIDEAPSEQAPVEADRQYRLPFIEPSDCPVDLR